MNVKTLSLFLVAAITLTGCKKDKDDPVPTPPGPSNPPALNPPDAQLIGMVLDHETSDFQWQASLASAYFKNNGTNVQVGSVTLNGAELIWAEFAEGYLDQGNSPDLNSTQLNWSIEGGNGYPAFTTNGGGAVIPTMNGITSPLQMTAGSNYTLSTSGLAGADSVQFIFGDVSRAFAGNVNSTTFTAAQLGTWADSTSAPVSIHAMKRVRETHGGKTVDMMLMRFVTREIIIQ